MAYIRLPLGMRVALEYEVFGKVVVNVYHVTTTDPIITLKLLEVANIFQLWFDTELSQGQSANLALQQITVLNLDVENGEKITSVMTPEIPGKDAGAAVSNNVALVASFATAKTGRSFRGRSYIAGLTEAAVTANEITPILAAAFVAIFAALRVLLDADNNNLVVASFESGGVPRTEGIATEVESISVNARVDTQRRRLPR